MIHVYDEVQQKVKTYLDKIKRKTSVEGLEPLSMSLIMKKNKKINEEKKSHKEKMISSRKLKIKVSEVLNFKILDFRTNKIRQFQPIASSIDKKKKANGSTQKMNKNISMKTIQTKRILKTCPKPHSLKEIIQQKTEEKEENINLFSKFNDQQLNQIQLNEQYYLIKPEFIQIFRRFMIKKRLNNKDYTYDNFMLKNSRSHSQYLQFQDKPNITEAKAFILKNLGRQQEQKKVQNQFNLLTNPSYDKSSTILLKNRSNSQICPKKDYAKMFENFRLRQQDNKQKLINEFQKRKLQLKIDLNYFHGIADEKRQIINDFKRKKINSQNQSEMKKSLICRERLETMRDLYGKTVDYAEIIRKKILINLSRKRSNDKSTKNK